MLKVTGVMTLQRVINENITSKTTGKIFQKVELHGYVETGWSGQNMPQSLPVAISPNKSAKESLGELSMIAIGSKLNIEGYVKGNPWQDKLFISVIATKIEVSNMGMHYAPAQTQQVYQQPQVIQQPPGLDEIPF